jgi:hypothetical protein
VQLGRVHHLDFGDIDWNHDTAGGDGGLLGETNDWVALIMAKAWLVQGPKNDREGGHQ